MTGCGLRFSQCPVIGKGEGVPYMKIRNMQLSLTYNEFMSKNDMVMQEYKWYGNAITNITGVTNKNRKTNCLLPEGS